MIAKHSWLRALLAAASLFAGVAAAQDADHTVYLDVDNDAATGCSATTPAGNVAGAEFRIVAHVAGTPPAIVSVTRAACTGGAFEAPQVQPAAYAVGLNNGTGGADVVEIGTPLAGLGQGGPARVVFVSSNANGADSAAGIVPLPGNGSAGPVEAIVVPATGIVAIVLCVGFLLLVARKHPAFGSSLALLLLLGAGTAWAANFVADGLIGDWGGVAPLAVDAPDDATASDPRVEIVAAFAATENGMLFLRLDVQDAQAADNTAPVLNDASFVVPENSAAGTVVGNAVATDANAGQTLAYAITAGNTGNAFAISASGQITVTTTAALNFETAPPFALTVTATDNGVPVRSDSATITVTLANVNEAPQLADATRTVAEDSAAGSTAGAPLTGSDPDADDTPTTFAYAITAGNTNGALAISNTGQLTVSNAAEVSSPGTFTLTITLTDDGGLSDSATVLITVSDQNDAPVFTGEPYAFTVPENSAAGILVGSTTTTDADAGQTTAYAITAGNTGSAFAISPTGQITVDTAAALDFETTPVFTLTVTATDDGAPVRSDTTTVTVSLDNVNEAPVANDATFAVPEDATLGSVVGQAVATDVDAGQTLSYAIVGGNTGNAFAISTTGEITVATPALDFETSPSFSLSVTVADNGVPVLSDGATITIDVSDRNEPPVFPDSTIDLQEHSPNGTAVLIVGANDPDTGQSLTYAITAGNTGGAFAIESISGGGPATVAGLITVANSAALDLATTPVFTLTVTVTDGGAPALSDTAQVTITLTPMPLTIGGTVSGLSGSLILQNNGSDDLPLNVDGGFTFPTPAANGSSYNVTVLTQPATQTCTVNNGSGTLAGADVTNVAVICTDNLTSLSASVSDLALSVSGLSESGVAGTPASGAPRTIVVTNTGAVAAFNLAVTTPTMPAGTTMTTTCGASLAPGDNCTLTLTPGATASSDGTQPCTVGTTPIPGVLQVQADNAAVVSANVVVLGYGCVYQGGHVYAFDDTMPGTQSVAGKVAATADAVAAAPGVVWSSNGTAPDAVSYDIIPGIDETSTMVSGSPTFAAAAAGFASQYINANPFAPSSFAACRGATDGACNAGNVLTFYNNAQTNYGTTAPPYTMTPGPTNASYYAAGACTQPFAGYSDWYLPAICELGTGAAGGCGTAGSPTLQNMQSNLATTLGLLTGTYWSSTESSTIPAQQAWAQAFDGGSGLQIGVLKQAGHGVRCSRAF